MFNYIMWAIMIICGISATVLFLMGYSYYIMEMREEREIKKIQDDWYLKTLD